MESFHDFASTVAGGERSEPETGIRQQRLSPGAHSVPLRRARTPSRSEQTRGAEVCAARVLLLELGRYPGSPPPALSSFDTVPGSASGAQF